MRRFLSRQFARPLVAFFRMPGARGFGALIVAFFAIVTGAVIDLRLNYIHPETGEGLDTFESVYSVLSLLVFNPTLPLPQSWGARVVFLTVPLSGILVLGQGLVRLGSTLMNRDRWNRAMASTYRQHVIVCGLGKVGLRAVRWMLDLKEEVVVIELRPDNPFVEEVRRWGVPVMVADARRAEALEDAGINQAEAIVTLTNDDLVNLSIALESRRLVPRIKVVLRMADAQMAGNLRTGFDIRTAFSIPEIAAPAFAAAATKAPLDHAFVFGEGEERSLLTITKFTVVEDSVLVGYTVARLEAEFDVAVIAHRRHGDGSFRLHPPDDALLAAGDRFVVSASIEALNAVACLTPPTRQMDRYLQGSWPIKSRGVAARA